MATSMQIGLPVIGFRCGSKSRMLDEINQGLEFKNGNKFPNYSGAIKGTLRLEKGNPNVGM